MAIYWESAVFLAFPLCWFALCRPIICVRFSFGIWDRKWNWNSIVSVPDNCLSSLLFRKYMLLPKQYLKHGYNVRVMSAHDLKNNRVTKSLFDIGDSTEASKKVS